MSTSKKPEEQPKRRVAKQVITQKRKYFVPSCNVTVDASSAGEAAELAKKALVADKEGDA